MKILILVLVFALLGAAVADLPNNDADQLETPDSSVPDAARTEDINAIPTESFDPQERERAEIYSTAAHLSNHVSFGGINIHSDASPYASLFQIQETDSRRMAEKDMQLDNMNIVPEELDDSKAPVVPFFASAEMTEIADPLLDVETEHNVDEQEDQALDHAADVLSADVEAADVAELAMSAPSLVEEEELPRVMPHDGDDDEDDVDESTFIETVEDEEEADEEEDDEDDDEAEDQNHMSDEEHDETAHTVEHDDSFDDHSVENAEPANAEQADDAAKNVQAPAAAPESAPIPAGAAAPTGDVTNTVQDQ